MTASSRFVRADLSGQICPRFLKCCTLSIRPGKLFDECRITFGHSQTGTLKRALSNGHFQTGTFKKTAVSFISALGPHFSRLPGGASALDRLIAA